jgi:hypothetical protein
MIETMNLKPERAPVLKTQTANAGQRGVTIANGRRFRRLVVGMAGVFWFGVCQLVAAPAVRLPDGTDFVFWEQPLTFSKTYYVDGSSPKSDDSGPGTRERPFSTIGKAAEILQSGERVVIAAGVYRECVRPARGGTGADKMISYEAAPGAAVFVRGSVALAYGWEADTAGAGRGRGSADGGAPVKTWKHELPAAIFPDNYNPFALASLPGNWGWLDTKKVDMGPYFRRRGLVFVDGKPLEPVEQVRELGNTPLQRPPRAPNQPPPRTGMPERIRGGPIMQEIGGSPDGRFAVEHNGNALHVRVPGDDPAKHLVEITVREQVFAPRQAGLGYIRVKGLTFQHAGNAYPPPQHGLVSTTGGHHWIIEGNTIEWANGVGLDLGSQGWGGGERTAGGGSAHIVRGNTIRYCGVEGIGGMGTQNMLVEDNLLEWIGWADAERAWEAAAIKLHGARNFLFRRNVVRHIRHANALWLDSNNSNCRITGNVFADVVTVSAAIHMEMNRNFNLIDDNVIWDVRNAEPGTPGQRGAAGSGIFLHASDRQSIVQNLIGRCDNAGVFPVYRDDRNGSGLGHEHQVYNNIFARCGKAGVVFLHEQNEADGNLYASLPEKFSALLKPDSPQWLDFPAWQALGWDKHGTRAELEVEFDADTLELTLRNAGAWPKAAAFHRIETDLFGQPAGERRAPGPLADPGAQRVRRIDPRIATRGP